MKTWRRIIKNIENGKPSTTVRQLNEDLLQQHPDLLRIFTSATPRNPLQRKPWHRLVTWHPDFRC
jgi:hypothetical protein